MLVLWRLPVGIASCCKAELGRGGKLVSKQITLPRSSCRQLYGSRAVAAPCHEPGIAPAPNQQSGRQPAPGSGWELEKPFWFQQALEQSPWQGTDLFWSAKLLTSLPPCLGCSVLGTLCQQKTAPKNKQLTKGVVAHPSNQLPAQEGGERRGKLSGSQLRCSRGALVPLTLGECVWLPLAPCAWPRAPALSAPQHWDLGSSMGSSTRHMQALRDLSGYVLANKRWGRKCDSVFTVLQQSQAKQSQLRALSVVGSTAVLPSLCQTRENKS